MQTWIQFTRTNKTRFNNKTMKHEKIEPYQQNILGSDGVFIPDGRYNLDSAINSAYPQIFRLKNICKIDGFKVYQGKFLNTSKLLFEKII